MPWKNNKPMDQRIEFAMKAMETENFRALCDEYGISAKTGYKWRERIFWHCVGGVGGMFPPPQGPTPPFARRGGGGDGRIMGRQPHLGPAQQPGGVFLPPWSPGREN